MSANRGPRRGQSAQAREAARLAAEQEARRRRERRLLIAAVAVLILVVVGGGLGLQAWRTGRSPSAPDAALVATDVRQTLVDGQPIRTGAADAPVTLRLYEDFHCPHCADLEEEVGPTLVRAQAEGRVKVELHPMSFIDEGSTSAANALACATEAGFGQRYYAGLFANATLRWSDEQLLDLARVLGVPEDPAFSTCVTSRARIGWVDSIDAGADAAGVTGTPTLFLNGAPVPLEGMTAEKMDALIEAAVPPAAK